MTLLFSIQKTISRLHSWWVRKQHPMLNNLSIKINSLCLKHFQVFSRTQQDWIISVHSSRRHHLTVFNASISPPGWFNQWSSTFPRPQLSATRRNPGMPKDFSSGLAEKINSCPKTWERTLRTGIERILHRHNLRYF